MAVRDEVDREQKACTKHRAKYDVLTLIERENNTHHHPPNATATVVEKNSPVGNAEIEQPRPLLLVGHPFVSAWVRSEIDIESTTRTTTVKSNQEACRVGRGPPCSLLRLQRGRAGITPKTKKAGG